MPGSAHLTREDDFGCPTLGFLRVGLSFASVVSAPPFLNVKLPGAPHSSSVAQTFSLCIVRTPHRAQGPSRCSGQRPGFSSASSPPPGAPHSSSVAQTFSLCIVPHATRNSRRRFWVPHPRFFECGSFFCLGKRVPFSESCAGTFSRVFPPSRGNPPSPLSKKQNTFCSRVP
jgi:hypothetical protein